MTWVTWMWVLLSKSWTLLSTWILLKLTLYPSSLVNSWTLLQLMVESTFQRAQFSIKATNHETAKNIIIFAKLSAFSISSFQSCCLFLCLLLVSFTNWNYVFRVFIFFFSFFASLEKKSFQYFSQYVVCCCSGKNLMK